MRGVDMIPAVRDEGSAPFFDAAREGVLKARRCTDCAAWASPASMIGGLAQSCTACHGKSLEWAPVSGRATLITWTILPDLPSLAGNGGLRVTGLVELEEGPWLMAGLDVQPDDLAAGMPLEVGFVQPEEGEPLPLFRTPRQGVVTGETDV
jgi:uncharacterized protein